MHQCTSFNMASTLYVAHTADNKKEVEADTPKNIKFPLI